MKLRIGIVSAGIGLLAMQSLGFAAESATGVVDLQSINGSGASQTFTYKITLTDTGTTNIGSFWYAWLPPDNFYDFLTSPASATTSPAGWSATLEGLNSGNDHNSILWTTTTAPLTPGHSVTFGFTTPDNFANITGASSPFGYPKGYSYIYVGGPEAPGDGGALVNVLAGSATPVPEPASLGILAVGLLLVPRRRRGRAA